MIHVGVSKIYFLKYSGLYEDVFPFVNKGIENPNIRSAEAKTISFVVSVIGLCPLLILDLSIVYRIVLTTKPVINPILNPRTAEFSITKLYCSVNDIKLLLQF